MKRKKDDSFSFEEEGKESISTRLRGLIGDRSIRAAAKDWGLSFSTLNNYLTRGIEPSLNVALKIAHVEHVSVEWIATGKDGDFLEKKKNELLDRDVQEEKIKNKWLMILDSIDLDDADSLIKAIHRKGITSIIEDNRADEDVEDIINSLDIRFTLKQAIKEALKGDEKLDQEILRRIENRKNSLEAGQQSLDQPELQYKNIG